MPEIVYGNVRVPVSEHTAALYEWQRLDLIKHPSNRNPPRWWFSFRIGAYRKAGTHSGGSALDERVSWVPPPLRPPLRRRALHKPVKDMVSPPFPVPPRRLTRAVLGVVSDPAGHVRVNARRVR